MSINRKTAVLDTVPAGTVIYVAQSTAPNGYIKANGATLSREAYKILFNAIGTAFGAGDGSSTFSIPDLRGEWVRGWDDSRGVDSGRTFGSFQNGSRFYTSSASVAWNNAGDTEESITTGTAGNHPGNNSSGQATTFGRVRVRNVALLACIKF